MAVYRVSRKLLVQCYKIASKLPSEEKFTLGSQIRRAALSVHLNIVEAASRKSATERYRFYEVARGSLIEVGEAFDIAKELQYLSEDAFTETGPLTIECFRTLCGLMKYGNRKPGQ